MSEEYRRDVAQWIGSSPSDHWASDKREGFRQAGRWRKHQACMRFSTGEGKAHPQGHAHNASSGADSKQEWNSI